MSLVIIGLGNPGEKFNCTRHNVGFDAVDRLAEELEIHLKKPMFKQFLVGRSIYNSVIIFLIKPLTYMNCSGRILKNLFQYTNTGLKDIIILCDTIDLPAGQCRLKSKGSSAGQKGLENIIQCAGTDEIPRIFIGIDRPPDRDNIVPYVLGRPGKRERELINQGIDRAVSAVLQLADRPIGRVMNEINSF